VGVRNDPTYGYINHRYNSGTFAYEANHDFSSAGVVGSRGLAWDGTRFWSRSIGAPRLYKHTTWDWTTESPKYWFAYTWYDGTHETLVSPRCSLDLTNYRRARVLVTVPTFPGTITKARIYAARNATAPATTALHLQVPSTYVDTDAATAIRESDFNNGGAAPPTSNGFGAGTSAEIKGAPTATGITGQSNQGDGTMRPAKGSTSSLSSWTPGGGEGSLGYDSTLHLPVFWNGSAWEARSASTYTHSLATDVQLSTPAPITYDSGTFTPTSSEVVVDVSVAAAGWEGDVRIEFLYGDASLAPLNTNQQAVLAAGTSIVVIGTVSGAKGTTARTFKITGLTPGQPVAWELLASIEGGAARLELPEAPFAVSAQKGAALNAVKNGTPGAVLAAARSQNHGYVIRVDHWTHPGYDWLIADVALSSNTLGRPAVSPDGSLVVFTNYGQNEIVVLDMATMNATTYALPGPQTQPRDVAITPDGATAWISCNNGASGGSHLAGSVVPFDLAAFTFGTAVAVGSGPLIPKIRPDAAELYVPNFFDTTISVVRLSDRTVVATITVPFGPVGALAVLPDNSKVLALAPATSGGPLGIYTITTSTHAISSPFDTGLGSFNSSGIVIFSDGKGLLVSGNSSGSFQIAQYSYPDFVAFTQWANNLAGNGIQPAPDITLTPNAAILVPAGSGINDWYGGQILIRPSTSERFFAEHSAVAVQGAH
jgi:hypothetical protein